MKPDFQTCGLAKTLKVIGSKWTLAIIYELDGGPKRFNDLQRTLQMSPRTLSLRLVQMEQDRIISKKVFAEMPPHVEYALTRKGQSLEAIIGSMCEWGSKVRVSATVPEKVAKSQVKA